MKRGAGARREREKRDPLATRRALLQAGAALFSERGMDGVSIEEVAAQAGVNKALISYHFRGKRGLYAAILEAHFGRMATHLKQIEAEAQDARQALHGFLSAFLQMTRDVPGFPSLFLREVLSSGVEPAVLPHIVEIVGVSRRLADRAAREGLFRRVDPLLFHFGLVGTLIFFFSTEEARQKAAARLPFAMPDAKAFVRYVEELTLRGLAPEDRSRRTRGLAPENPSGPPRGLAPESRSRRTRGLAPENRSGPPRGLAPESSGRARAKRKGARV